ncbi:MAG: hypothetical protein CBC71_04720 [Rhodobacteraceae bacterium TMED111]|nr:hypothetical protein [Marinovum sp.]OUV42011.1 MAG: hypothetical protein CBC71_04720 [Rhodobacteraceae bacterium TMED111]
MFMEMVLGINKNLLSKAFIEREREIFADSKDKEKKRKKRNFSRKKFIKDKQNDIFENFHSIDLIG